MPTLFEQLDSVLDGSGLFKLITEKAGSLGSTVKTVTQLIDNPPDDLGDLQRLINEISLPDLNIGGDFAAGLGDLKKLIPTDLSSLTGNLTSGLENLNMTVVGEVTGLLADSLKAVQAIYELTQMNFKCEDEDTENPGADNPGNTDNPGNPGNPGTHPAGGGLLSAPAAAEGDTAASQPSPGEETLAQINSVLDLMPSTLDAKSILAFIHNMVDWGEYIPFRLPILDDLRDPIDTLLKWDSMDATAITGQLKGTLGDIKGFINGCIDQAMNPLTVDVPGLASRMDMGNLKQLAEDLAARLSEAGTAVADGDTSGIGTAASAIETLLDQYDSLIISFRSEVVEKLPALNKRLNALPNDIQDSMGHLLSVLQPGDVLASFDSLLPGTGELENLGAFEEMEKALGTFVKWFEDLVKKINLGAVKEPLKTVADGIRTAVDALDEAMVKLTLGVQTVFGKVESLLDKVDIEAVMSKVEKGIQDFQSELKQFTSLFEKVHGVIKQAVTTIENAVAAFNAKEIIDTLKGLFEGLTSVLEKGSALSGISSTLEKITGTLKELAFTPVTDQVVGLIEGVKQILNTISSIPLSSDLEQSLQSAMARLPGDIKPTTDTIVSAFEDLVQSGPVETLEMFNRQCKKFFKQVREFEPSALLGDTLTKPYLQLLAKMEPFKPGTLLKPLQEVLDKLKERLKENVNPAQFIQPLEPMFDEITGAFEKLNPVELIKPLEEMITGAVDQLLKLVPMEDIFAKIEEVLDAIKNVVSIGNSIKTIAQRAHDLVKGFSDAEGLLKTWTDSILAKVDFSGGWSQLQPLLGEVKTALDNTRSASLANRFNQVMDPLLNDIDTLAPQDQLTAVVQAYRGISRQALDQPPYSDEKGKLSGVLDRFDPMTPEFNVPYQTLADWKETLVQVKTKFGEVLVDWDQRYHAEGGILADFCSPATDAAQLRQMMSDTIESQLIKPLSPLFTMAKLVHRTVGSFLSQFQQLISTVQKEFEGLFQGPDSLGGIIDTLKELVQRVDNFNLDFIKESLESLFNNVRGKLDAVSPKRLREKLEELFNDMLDMLDLGLLISPEDVTQLDKSFEEVLKTFKELNPDTILTEVFQKEFDENIVPMLDVFDLSKYFDPLLERLHTLDDELKTEMVRVNGAYREMRQAV